MSRLTNYFQDVRTEMKHVSWPTKHQALVFTALVVGVSVGVALLLGLADFVFSKALNMFISLTNY